MGEVSVDFGLYECCDDDKAVILTSSDAAAMNSGIGF